MKRERERVFLLHSVCFSPPGSAAPPARRTWQPHLGCRDQARAVASAWAVFAAGGALVCVEKRKRTRLPSPIHHLLQNTNGASAPTLSHVSLLPFCLRAAAKHTRRPRPGWRGKWGEESQPPSHSPPPTRGSCGRKALLFHTHHTRIGGHRGTARVHPLRKRYLKKPALGGKAAARKKKTHAPPKMKTKSKTLTLQ